MVVLWGRRIISRCLPLSRLTYTAQVLTHGRVARSRLAQRRDRATRYGHAVKYISTSYLYV